MRWHERFVIVITVLFSCGIDAGLVEAHVGTGIDLGRGGRVYFTDALHNPIWRLDPDGKLTSLAQGMHLDFLIVGDGGNLYLVDDHAWRLTPQGGLTEVVRSTDTPKTLAWAFAVDDQGNIKGQTRFGRVNTATVSPDGSISLRRKIILVPPLEFSRWRQRHTAGFLAPNQITTHRDHGFAALRPNRRDDVGCARSPIKTGKHRFLDLERIHHRDDVRSNCRWLTVAERLARKKARRSITAQVRNDHSVTSRG